MAKKSTPSKAKRTKTAAAPRTKAAFPDIAAVPFVERGSRAELGFRHYRPDEKVEGKPMREHLRFASAYWHTMRNGLADPFGAPTALMPWDDGTDSLANAARRIEVFAEFLTKCRIDHWCFHDRDIAPEGATLAESHRNLDAIVKVAKDVMKGAKKRLLWGTACLFAHPRYASGAATSPSLAVYAYAAAQVKKAIEVTHELGGEGYVFWGGREGYTSLLNTDMKREREQLARFLHMAVDHKKKIGFKGRFYIEPKPREPSVHQYDSDAAACLAFLREFDLLGELSLNIETNHATLAGHTMEHELTVARDAQALGSIDANMGTDNCGWDTDEFPIDVHLTTKIMLIVLSMGGFTSGGLNFDAKRRRESFEPKDLFHAHVAGMDAFARGLKAAAAIRADGRIAEFVRQRYRSWNTDLGLRVRSGASSFEELANVALGAKEPSLESGRQEWLEAIVQEYL
ncbi:MAG: xylose isomerase [Phycisphaerae bacterium]|nr:xylose isomerase [Phycisphaerae bacterium]